jgi:hypothetical protein
MRDWLTEEEEEAERRFPLLITIEACFLTLGAIGLALSAFRALLG